MADPEHSSCFSVYSILSKACNICSNLCTKGTGKIVKAWLNLQPRSLLSCFTEFMPTAFRYALASSIKDQLNMENMCFPCLLLPYLGFLSNKLLKRTVTFLPPFHHFLLAWFTTLPHRHPTPLYHSAFWRINGDDHDSVQSTFTLYDLRVTFRTVDSSLTMHLSFGFRNFRNSWLSSYLLGCFFAVSSLFILLLNVKVYQSAVLAGLITFFF